MNDQTECEQLALKVKAAVRDWLAANGGDRERTARWMRDSLRIGGIRICREIIAASAV